MAVEINYSKILEDRSSFQIARTNPKLTGNVKFTVDGNDNMWLNSIDANDELSKDLYKRVAIDPSMSLSGNMFKFFNNGSTPSDIVFDLKESFDNTKTSNDFKDQYDFSNYFSGAKYLTSKRYDERMSYFAPLYLKKDVPEFFVIFKIEDPVNKKISDLKSEYPFNRETYIKEMFKKSSIIKTFDLRETTKVGKYIRDYIESDSFPESSLSVTYQEDESTEWNGILYDSGVIGSRGELLNEFYSTSAPLKRFEEFITGGFQRNGVILPNILNMEFIFNDDTSEIYDFNRYFGVYVNAIELSKFDIDLDRSYSERAIWENTPAIRRQYKEWETASVSQANPNGVILAAKNTNLYLSDFKDIFTDKSNMFFNYVTDKSHNIYLPKLDQPYDIDYDITGVDEKFSGKIRLSNTNIKLNDFYGPGEVFIQDEGLPSKISGFSHSYIKIGSLSHLDEIKVYHLNGTRVDSNGRYDSIIGTSGYSLVPNPEDFYVYNDIDLITGFDTFYFNIDGSIQQVATALTGCLNGIRHSRFEAFAFNEYVFIKVNVPGDSDVDYKIEFSPFSTTYTGITVNGTTGDGLISTLINFKGGSRSNKNRLVISSDHNQKILDNIDDLLVKTKNGWSKIKKVSNYIDTVVEKNTATDLTRRTAISSFTDNIVLVLEQDSEPVVEYKNFLIKKKHRPSFGLLSFLPIKDFDFDFYSSEYLNFPVIDSYKHYYIPPNVDLLEEDTTYEVLGTGSIEYPIGSGTSYSSSDTIYVSAGGSKKYAVISGNAIVVYKHTGTVSFTDLHITRLDGNEEYENFEGFFTIKDPDKITAVLGDDVFKLKTKYLNGIAGSEYEYFKENESLDFSLRSKILPYITKWVATDGTDSRNNPYRLNSELVFGFNNFSPDHNDTSQNPSNFTHEWFYIESKFNYLDDAETAKLNNSYFDTALNINDILTQEGEFTDYFTYTPEFAGKEIAETQTRYAPINKNNQGIYQALFKGFKISFKDYIDPANVDSSGKPKSNPNSNRFEDYKFTAILKPVKEEIDDRYTSSTPPIRYRLIEHKDFKFVILVIEISLGSIDKIDPDWKTLPGSVDNTNYLGSLTSNKLLKTVDELVPSITVNTSDGIPGIYPNVNLSTISGTGSGAIGTVTVSSALSVSGITVTTAGSSYVVGDVLKIDKAVIGGTTDVEISLNVDDFTTLNYQAINGDYRFKFDPDVNNIDVSDLTHTSLYSIRHKKYNNTVNNYSNVKLSSIIDISSAGANALPVISNITVPDISNYPSSLSDEISSPGVSNFIIQTNKQFNVDTIVIHDTDLTTIDTDQSKLIGSTKNTIIYSVNSDLREINQAGGLVGTIPTVSSSQYYRDNYISKVLSGGKSYYQSLFEKISFAGFRQYLNTLNPFIEYESYEYSDTGGLVSSTGKWFAEISDTSTIIKNTAILAVEDSNKPSNVAFNQKVGYRYESVPLDNSYELNRYDGGFSPLFKNLFTFNSKFKFTSNTDIADLDLSNTMFNIDIDKFLTIKNFNHIKVANSKILSLEADDEFDPQYELIDEIAIGRSDYDMLSSNWDYGFHQLYSSKNIKNPASGALRVEEDDSFISKLINLRETFELDFKDFTIPGTDFQKVNDLNSVNIDEIEIVYVENDTDIKGIINIENAITRYLLKDGILAKFEQFLSVGSDLIGNYKTVEDYAKDYILINILKLYEIEEVEFYEKLDKTLVEQASNSNSNAIEFRFLNDKERFNEGYELNKNLGINKLKRLLLEFNLKKRLNSGLLISPKVKIKFI